MVFVAISYNKSKTILFLQPHLMKSKKISEKIEKVWSQSLLFNYIPKKLG